MKCLHSKEITKNRIWARKYTLAYNKYFKHNLMSAQVYNHYAYAMH